MDFWQNLFDTSDFPARWYCGRWTDGHGWLHVLSDLGIWAAYFTIPCILVYFTWRRADLPFQKVFLLFGAFILLCGSTHLMEAVIFWWPAYRLAGVIKFVTAAVSWATIIALAQVAPVALAMRSPEELEREIVARRAAEDALIRANGELEKRIAERTEALSKANAALQSEREWFSATLISIGDAVITTDAEGSVTMLNPIAEKLTGWTQQEAAGHPLTGVFNIVNEDSRDPVENPALRAMQLGTIVGLANHTILIAKDLQERPIDDSAAPIRNEQGDVVGSVLIFRDVTERKRSEESLRESEERLRLALEAGHMGVWDWDIETDQIQWSNNLETIYGLEPGSFGGGIEDFQKIVHADDRKLIAASIAKSLRDGSMFQEEFRNVWPDGSVYWMFSKGRVITEKDGQPKRMVGVGMDITERKRAEQNAKFLSDASAALAALVDYQSTIQHVAWLAVPYFADWCTADMLDADGSIQRLVVAHVDKEKVALAHELHFRFPPDPDAATGVWNILRTGKSELIAEISDGLLSSSARDGDMAGVLQELGLKSYIGVPLQIRGRTIGVITFIAAESGRRYDQHDLAVAEDLAHRASVAIDNANLYQSLQESDRRKSEFLATLAHELRNPLAPIRTGLEVMKLSRDNPDIIDNVRDTLERQTKQLITLVDDLLDVSRITRGKLEIRKSLVKLRDVVRSAVEASKPFIDEAGHELTVTVPEQPILLNADPNRLAQVISNLLNNAAKYTPKGGKVTLVAKRQENEVVISVKDNGVGIPVDLQQCIFEMFTQIDDQQMEHGLRGLGIGLTLVSSLVEMHEGKIEVSSEGKSRGSEFTVRLPAVEGVQDAPQEVGRPDKPVTKSVCRVLVVDDNKAAADMLAMVVKMLGNEVRTASDGKMAITVAAEFRPDVVLMDIGMPNMNGYEAARHIRQQPWGQRMRLVALTGWGQDEDKRRTKEAGFDHHLVKPAEPAELQRLLNLDAQELQPEPAG